MLDSLGCRALYLIQGRRHDQVAAAAPYTMRGGPCWVGQQQARLVVVVRCGCGRRLPELLTSASVSDQKGRACVCWLLGSAAGPFCVCKKGLEIGLCVFVCMGMGGHSDSVDLRLCLCLFSDELRALLLTSIKSKACCRKRGWTEEAAI